MRKVVLTPAVIGEDNINELKKYADVYTFDDLEKGILEPEKINAMIVQSWPKSLSNNVLSSMKNLEFVQSVLVGVNHIPVRDLPEKTILCSNSGAYSEEVGEFVFALLLASAKKITEFDSSVKSSKKELSEYSKMASEIKLLYQKNIGIIGYGSIGKYVARVAKSFGMKVNAFVRREIKQKGVEFYYGRDGLEKLLKNSDFVVLAVPLTRETEGMIGERELSLMKKDAVLVNVARGDLVRQDALYKHLLTNKDFYYATDVFWFKEGRETLSTDFPFYSLKNFICTPHVSGPTALFSGKPYKLAVRNTIRYLKGLRPNNIVNRKEY